MAEGRLRLLGFFAHPDDETFGSAGGPGGTLARYAAEGVEVHACIVTDGAAGEVDPALLEGYAGLAERRRVEVERAARILGVRLHRLDYRDSGMIGSAANAHPDSLHQATLERVARDLVRLIREIRPHVVITHNPQGEYFHPDHLKVHHATLRAWELVDDAEAFPELDLPPWRPERLFWSAIPEKWVRRQIRLARLFRRDPTRMGRNGDVDFTQVGTPEKQIHVRVDVRPYLATKRAAMAQHASQRGDRIAKVPLWLLRLLWREELFTQAYPSGRPVARDLFAGMA